MRQRTRVAVTFFISQIGLRIASMSVTLTSRACLLPIVG